jgi:hypothetical protein
VTHDKLGSHTRWTHPYVWLSCIAGLSEVGERSNSFDALSHHWLQLLASAGHVALYDFLTGEKKWVHKGVEGTLFLIRRQVVPIYRYIVLNKKSQGDSSRSTPMLNL